MGSVKPTAVAPGSGAFTLSVYGANFVSGATVNWNYQPRSTTFVSAHELQAQILAADVAKPTAGMITVTNPSPGGGRSSASYAQVEAHVPTSTIDPGPPLTVNAIQFPFGGGPPVLADLTGDNNLDLVYGSIVTLGRGDGTFKFDQILPNYRPPFGVTYGDFNGDGKLDIAYVAGDSGNISRGLQLNVMLGDGTGKFTLGSKIQSYAGFGWILAGDFNGDGKLDLVAMRGQTLTVYFGNGDGTFAIGPQYVLFPGDHQGSQLVAGDFNNDGKLDIVGVDTTGAVFMALGNGDGTFRRPAIAVTGDGWGCAGTEGQTVIVDDFNGDGNLDLVACNQSSAYDFEILLGNGDGTFQAPIVYPFTPQDGYDIISGDFNSDGKVDLILSLYGFTNAFGIFLGNGDGTFQPEQIISLGKISYSGEYGMAVGDFNSDGLLDFLLLDAGGIPVVFVQK
jgi:FG-GAP-like repeat